MIILIDAWTGQDEKETEAHFVNDDLTAQLTAYREYGTAPSDSRLIGEMAQVARELRLPEGGLAPEQRKEIAAHWVRKHGEKTSLPRWSATLF